MENDGQAGVEEVYSNLSTGQGSSTQKESNMVVDHWRVALESWKWWQIIWFFHWKLKLHCIQSIEFLPPENWGKLFRFLYFLPCVQQAKLPRVNVFLSPMACLMKTAIRLGLVYPLIKVCIQCNNVKTTHKFGEFFYMIGFSILSRWSKKIFVQWFQIHCLFKVITSIKHGYHWNPTMKYCGSEFLKTESDTKFMQ